MAETYQGDEVYQDRYLIKAKHVFVVVMLTLVVPFCIAIVVLNSFNGEIDENFIQEVILQKAWLGNECPIDLNDASEILQYKHFICECTIVGLCGVWFGQFTEWYFLSNSGIINQSPWLWHQTVPLKTALRLLITPFWILLNLLPIFLTNSSSFEMAKG